MDFKSGFVAVIGRPNVGKSTIINEFMGQKLTITSPKPQTTRHRIHAIDTTKNHQIVFVDTPGIHISRKKAINSYMNRAASSSLKDVDVILWLVEAGLWTKEDDRVLEHVSSLDCPVILVINKIDKLKHPDRLLPYLQDMSVKYNADEVYPLSAFKKNDVSRLKSMVLKYLPAQSMIFDPDFITDR